MTTALILLALALVVIVATLRDVFADRGGPRKAPTSHHEDPMFRAPAGRI